MKILIDVRLLGRGGFSGIEEYTREMVSNLLQIDRKNQFILFANQFLKSQNAHLKTWLNNPNVTLVNWHIPNRALNLSARLFHIPPIDSQVHADVVFSPHFDALSVRKAPHIIAFHDLSFLHHPDFFNRRRRLWHWLQNYQLQAKRAAYIIANSEFTKHDIINLLGIPEEKVTVIYPGVNKIFQKISLNDPEFVRFKKQHALPDQYILSLSTLEPRKNIPAIIKSFSLIKRDPTFHNLKLIIAGKPGWLYREILRTAKESPFSEHIRLWGPVENKDRVFLYTGARVFVYPSFFEGFGFPPLEAQMSDCPVIVADRTSLPEIVGNSGILINPWRIDELASAIKSILTNTHLREEFVKKGKENAQQFTFEKAAEKLHSLLIYGKTEKSSY